MTNFKQATWVVLATVIQHYVWAAEPTASGCHAEKISLSCSDGQTIEFQSIIYGWSKDSGVCDLTAAGCNKFYNVLRDIPIALQAFLKNFHQQCTNRTFCNITVSQQLLTDCQPGEKESTYAKIYYKCNSGSATKDYPTAVSTPTTPTPSTPVVRTSVPTSTHKSEPPAVILTEGSTLDNTRTDVPEVTTRGSTSTTRGSAGSGDALTGNEDDNMTAILAGSITGGVVLLIIIALVVVLVIRRKRTEKRHENGMSQDTQLHTIETEGTTNPAFSSYDEPFNNNPEDSEVSSKLDPAGTAQATNRKESNVSHTYAEVQDVMQGRARLPTLPSDEYADVYDSASKINSTEEGRATTAQEDCDDDPSPYGIGGVIYTQPLEPHLDNDTQSHQREATKSTQRPATRPPPPPLLPKPGHVSTSSPENTTGIPHEEIGGDLYAQPVKAAEKFEMTENEIQRQAPPPEDSTSIPHEEIGGDLYAQPVKATEKFEITENEIQGQALPPEDSTSIPHEEIGGDIYAQPVKATNKFEMTENEIYE